MKFDISFKVNSYHGRIYRYMTDNGIGYKEMCSRLGISQGTLASILKFKWFPNKNGHSGRVATKLANFFNCPIEELFPESLKKQIERNKDLRDLLRKPRIIHREVELEYLPWYAVPEISYEQDFDKTIENRELEEKLVEVFKTLSPREEKIIRMRFGIDEEGASLGEIGKRFGLSRNRIMQIEAKALRKMRREKRNFSEFLE